MKSKVQIRVIPSTPQKPEKISVNTLLVRSVSCLISGDSIVLTRSASIAK